jgi:pimeloyl-ACP methyl ester carboxylesterase
VQIGNVLVRYAVTGQGAPLLLIHGLAGSWRWWLRNVPALSERHTVYLIDLPGFGSMRAYRREFALENAPEWVRSLVDALGIERPSIAGHSMGAAISMAYAARWPECVDRLVLTAPAVDLPHKRVLSSVLPLLAAAGRVQPRFYPTLVWDAMRAGPFTLVRTANRLLAMDMAADAQQVHGPTLLIWGANDALVPPKIGHMLRSAIPSSRLIVFENAGHVVMFDRPTEFNDAVLRFLSGEAVGE